MPKDSSHGPQQSLSNGCATNMKKCMVLVKLSHLKMIACILPCLFIPLLLMYAQEQTKLSYADVHKRNAQLFSEWLEFKDMLAKRTIAPFKESHDQSQGQNHNEALFHHWSAHIGLDEPQIAKKRPFKRIIMDGIHEEVIVDNANLHADLKQGSNDKVNQGNPIVISGKLPLVNVGNGDTNIKPITQNKSKAQPITVTSQPKKKVPPAPKVILTWNEVYVKPKWFQFKKCPIRNCFVTSDKSRINESHAVIFNMGGQSPVRFRELLNLKRNPSQNWIFYQRDSQLRPLTSDKPELFNGLFNLTMTFKKSSTIWQPFYHFRLRTEALKIETNFAEGRTGLVAWMLGNCNEDSIPSKRMTYFKRLQTFVKADLFSNCPGATPCDNDCINSIYKNYKFIFAAESSLCEDFATAVTWKPLSSNIVPIVLGGSNYSSLLPQESFIDVRNFSSVELLANHIKKVAADDKLYNSHFKWKLNYELSDSHVGFCQLCTYLHKNSSQRIVQHNLEQYWDKTKDCVSAEQYYQGHM